MTVRAYALAAVLPILATGCRITSAREALDASDASTTASSCSRVDSRSELDPLTQSEISEEKWRAVRWLLGAQAANGSWPASGVGEIPAARSNQGDTASTESTCYVVLFLSTYGEDGGPTWVRSLRRGVDFLRRNEACQDPLTGTWPTDTRYTNALRALAISESYRAIGDPRWRPLLERLGPSLDMLAEYEHRPRDCGCDACTSLVECTTVLACRSLTRAGVHSPQRRLTRSAAIARDCVRRLLPQLASEIDAGRPLVPRVSPTCQDRLSPWLGLAAGLLAMSAADVPGTDSDIVAARLVLNRNLPRWASDEQTIDYRYWLYGTWAMEFDETGGRRKWSDAMWTVEGQEQVHETPPFRCEDAWSQRCGPAAALASVLLTAHTSYPGHPSVFRLLWP